uniref:Aminotran_1_2 domain-containing protein n=1 Tax=Panagrellus redivivus TaxID=6233 RepID=A0A7E4VWX0_PANRE
MNVLTDIYGNVMYHLSNVLSALQAPKFRAETLRLISNGKHSLSERCRKGLMIQYGINDINVLKASDPFHAEKNPEGHLDFSSADNILSLDLVVEKFNSIDWNKFDRTELNFYTTPGGTPETKRVFADLINEFTTPGLKNPVQPGQLLTIAGTTMVCDLLGQILFDEGDVMLTHSPFYHRFPNDFSDRGLIEIGEVSTITSKGFELKVERFEDAYQAARLRGKNVRAILLVNPRNPDAGYFTLDELKPIVDWAVKEHNLFVILDEIYDLSVYDPIEGVPFESAIRLFDNDPSLDRDKLVWMSGLSKNFSLPGLRTAVMYTPNVDVLAATRRFLMYQGPNATTEFIVRELVGDKDWVRNVFLPESNRRLRLFRDKVVTWLESVKQKTGKDITWVTPRAGFFIFINFGSFLDSKTFEAEERLQLKFFQQKVLFVRGKSLKMPVPGWFRIVFSSYDEDGLQKGLTRIGRALGVADL